MQTQGGQAVADVIEGTERSIRARVTVDWDGSGSIDDPIKVLDPWVENISVNRSLKGSAPEEILLVEGASAAELSMTIGGEYNGMSLTSVFSRYNKLSPLYGKRTVGARITYSLIVDTPVGEIEYPQFVGDVRTITPNRGDNTVDISALDLVELLRKPILLSKWAMHDSSVRWGEIDSQVCWSHAIIDMCLRQCDVSPGPKRPTTRAEMDVPDYGLDGVQFFLTGNGSYVPTVGWMDHPAYSSFPNRGKTMYIANAAVNPDVENDPDAGPLQGLYGVGTVSVGRHFPALPADEGYLSYWALNRDNMPRTGTYFMGFTINDPQQARAISLGNGIELLQVVGHSSRIFRIMINDGQMWAYRSIFRGNTPTDELEDGTTQKIDIPNVTHPIDVFVQWDNTSQSGSRCYIEVGDNNNAVSGEFPHVGSPVSYVYYKRPYDILGRIGVIQAIDLSDVFVSARNWYGADLPRKDQAYRDPGYAAVLDRGMNRLSHIPTEKPVEAWKIVTDVAAAEFGSVFWDETGVFRFWNQDHLVSKQQDFVRHVTLDHLEDLNMTDTLDSVRNVFTIEANRARSVLTNSVYSSNDEGQFETPANTTRTFQVWASDIIAPATVQFSRYQGTEGSVQGLPIYNNESSHGYVIQAYFPAGSQFGEGWYEYNAAISGVYSVAYFNPDGFLTVRVGNGNPYSIRFAKGLHGETNDSPALNIRGTKKVVSPSQTFVIRNQPSIERYGEKTLALSGDWYQDTYAANNMISTLMRRTGSPIPVTDSIRIPGDPRLQLADSIMMHDKSGLGDDLPAQILGINRDFSIDQGLTDVLTFEILQPSDGDSLPDVPEGSTVQRINLCTNPRVQNNEDGWFSSRQESGKETVVDFPGTSTGYFATNEVIMPRAFVEPGKTYTMSVYCIPAFTGYITVSADWYEERFDGDTQGRYWGNAGTKRILVHDGQLTRLNMTVTVPTVGKISTSPFIARFSGDAVFSQVLYEEGSVVQQYFDGDTAPPDTIWTGTDGNSTSIWQVSGESDDDGEIDPGDGDEQGQERHNLCTNPALGANASNWFAPDTTTGTRISVTDMTRPEAFQVVGVNTLGGLSTPNMEDGITSGQSYVLSVELRNDGDDTLEGQLQVHCKGLEGAWIGAYGDSDFSIVPGSVSRIACQPFVGPPDVVSMNGYIYASTQPFTVTACLMEPTDTNRPYFDGESENATWDGTRYNSTSTLNEGGSSSNPDGPPPEAEAGTAADTLNWGVPVAWDTFDYTGALDSEWSIYGNGGIVQPDGTEDPQNQTGCWLGHAGNGRRCVDQVSLEGSYLRISGTPDGDAGAISHSFGQQYGRWEVRARVGVNSSGNPYHAVLIIWPDSNVWPQDGEYDFFEVTLDDLNTLESWTHYPHEVGDTQQIFNSKSSVDLTEWHNYAIEWTGDHIKLFVDGVQWGDTMSGGARSSPPPARENIQDMPSGHLTIQVDNFYGSNMQDAYMDIEWVRVYDLSAAPVNPAPEGWQFFLDTSHYQTDVVPPIDLETVHDLGYSGNIVKIGQGKATNGNAALLDDAFDGLMSESMSLWPFTTAGYWFIGDDELPSNQASRCLSALGNNSTLPVMLDWEDGGGDWQNFLNVLNAFRNVGINATMLYTRESYANAHSVGDVTATGLNLVTSRFWYNPVTDDDDTPRVQWDDIVANATGGEDWGFATIGGKLTDAHQFTANGGIYPGMAVDCSAFPGSLAELSDMMHGN